MPTETPAPPSDQASKSREAVEADEQHIKKVSDEISGNGNGGGDAPPVAHEGGEPDDDEGPAPLELAIEGEGQLTLTVGGAKPDHSTIKLVGGKMDIASGDFDKGANVNILIKGRVTEVTFVDTYDQYGNISGTERRHKIRPFGVERIYD